MKKVTLWILTALVVIVCVQPVFAYDFGKHGEIRDKNGSKAAEAYMKRWDAFNSKATLLAKDARKLADKIAAFNKPAFEAQPTKEERTYEEMESGKILISPVVWSRVWLKDKTLVFGMAKKDKKFRATYFATTDPDFNFLGDIRVGASMKTLRNFFGNSIEEYTEGGKTVVSGPQLDGTDGYSPSIIIVCKNGLITEIVAYFTDGYTFSSKYDESCIHIYSEKAKNFARNKLKQMGFSYTDPTDPNL